MRAVNLLPADAHYRKQWWAADAVPASPRRILAGGGIVAGVLALSLAGAYILQKSIVDDRRATLAGLEREVTAAEAEAAVIRGQQDGARARLAAFTAVTSRRIVWETVLRDLARVLPPNAFLQTLSATSPTPSAVAAPAPTAEGETTGAVPTAFSVTGSTSSQPAVALVLDRLALLPWLSDVTLQSSTRGGTDTGGVIFTISANFNSTGGTG
ncbi:MAG: PilN domain-containing protein [Actinobacteria bacterium]|nr:PilN domain-containing protein [Actinomycetota bacterium]